MLPKAAFEPIVLNQHVTSSSYLSLLSITATKVRLANSRMKPQTTTTRTYLHSLSLIASIRYCCNCLLASIYSSLSL